MAVISSKRVNACTMPIKCLKPCMVSALSVPSLPFEAVREQL